HGEHFGEHSRVFGHMRTVYAQETRVPLVLIDPRRVPAGQVISAPVSLRDLPATILDLVGLESEFTFPGRSLARFWQQGGGDDPAGTRVLAEMEEQEMRFKKRTAGFWRSLAIGDNVYIRSRSGDEELYNIKADPAEQANLAGTASTHPMLEQFRNS